MTTARWDDLPADWSAATATLEHQPHPTHPLASPGGIDALNACLTAEAMWRHLTRAQRELLLSAAADAPIWPRSDVRARLVARGLIRDDLTITDAGRALVHWRTRTGR